MASSPAGTDVRRIVGCNGGVATSRAAELLIDEALVGDLIGEQCPDLAGLPVSRYGRGWDNEMFLLGERLLVRLPRHEPAAALIDNEVRWLPHLPLSPDLGIPQPVFVGESSGVFPWTWTIVNLVPGVVASQVPPADRRPAAAALADALWYLHAPAPASAPHNPYRGIALAQPRMDSGVRERAALVPHTEDLLARWDAWSHAPEFDGVDTWIHGDLHPHNLILDDRGGLAGIIDWGDACAGDPATDLATAWLTFDAAGRTTFIEHTTGAQIDDATWLRARAWALHLGLLLATNRHDDQALAAVGRHALAELLAEPV